MNGWVKVGPGSLHRLGPPFRSGFGPGPNWMSTVSLLNIHRSRVGCYRVAHERLGQGRPRVAASAGPAIAVLTTQAIGRGECRTWEEGRASHAIDLPGNPKNMRETQVIPHDPSHDELIVEDQVSNRYQRPMVG